MNRQQTMLTMFVALGLACGLQNSRASELPDEIRQFAAEQHQEILVQGAMARKAIRKEVALSMARTIEADRVAFMKSQRHDILRQGKQALASLQKDVAPVSLPAPAMGRESTVARTRGPARKGGELRARDYPALVGLEALESWTRTVGTEAIQTPLAGS